MPTETCSVCGVRGGHTLACRIANPQLYLAQQDRHNRGLGRLLPALAALTIAVAAMLTILALLLGGGSR